MEIGSSGAGSIAQNAPTQSGSLSQVNRAEKQQDELQNNAIQQSSPQAGQRVGSLVDISV
jgi:hypothetical protein